MNKKLLTIGLLALMLSGCGSVYGLEVYAASEYCAPRGGVYRIEVFLNEASVTCNDQTTAGRRVFMQEIYTPK